MRVLQIAHGRALGTYWSGNDFWGLPQAGPLHLQVGEGVEIEWFRAGKPEGLSESDQGISPCMRPGLE